MTTYCWLVSPGLEAVGKYYRCHSARRATLDLPADQFVNELWRPGRGLLRIEAAAIEAFLQSSRFAPGVHRLPVEGLLLEVYEREP